LIRFNFIWVIEQATRDVEIFRESGQQTENDKLRKRPYAVKAVDLTKPHIVSYLCCPDPPHKDEVAKIRECAIPMQDGCAVAVLDQMSGGQQA
jgi:hypothetical protein